MIADPSECGLLWLMYKNKCSDESVKEKTGTGGNMGTRLSCPDLNHLLDLWLHLESVKHYHEIIFTGRGASAKAKQQIVPDNIRLPA